MNKKSKVMKVFWAIILIVCAIVAFAPFIYMALISFTNKSVLDLNFDFSSMSLNNYSRIFKGYNIARAMLNSLIVTSGACIINCLVSSSAAYGFAKKQFKGRDGIFALYLATLMIPAQVTLIPMFLIMDSMHLLDTHIALMLPIVNAFGVFLMRQFMLSLPNELLQAAYVDGCGELKLFFKIVIPLVKSVMVSLTIFTFISCWNDFLWPLVVINKSDLKTLSLVIASLKGNFASNYGLLMAGLLLAFLPPFLLYIILQKEFVQGIALSGIKG